MAQGLSELEQFYEGDAYCGFAGDFNVGRYRAYADFVLAHARGAVHEIGSGLGQAAYALHERGVAVVATDIFPDNARKTFGARGIRIPVEKLNVYRVELPPGSVENFCCYQVMEHIERPQLALAELYRALRPGGRLIVVGPNLISPLATGKNLVMGLLGKWEFPLLGKRGAYSFPHGDNLVQIFLRVFRNAALTALKLALPSARRAMFRTPCLVKPAISDSDAVFLLNPMDLAALMRAAGFEITSYQAPQRWGSWAGSTWLVGEKPKNG